MGNFKKGLFIGGLLGAGLMWLNTTIKGKEYRTKILEHINPLYLELKENIKQLEGPTKEMWDALVERAVAEYAAKKNMAEDMKTSLVRELQNRWDQCCDEEVKESK